MLGDLFSPGPAVSGSKTGAAHCWKFCPYSTQSTDFNQDSRIPEIEKTFHSETSGQLHTYSLGGGLGWACADNDCSFFTGTATTEVLQATRRKIFLPSGTCPATEMQFATLSGTIIHSTAKQIIVSGTRYLEI